MLLLLLLLLLLLCPESKKGTEKVNKAATKDLFLRCTTPASLAKSLHEHSETRHTKGMALPLFVILCPLNCLSSDAHRRPS